jgi:hypothetical protein
VASHARPRSESPDQPPPEVGDLSVEWVEKQSVGQYAGILGQWGPVFIKDDKEVMQFPTSSSPLLMPGGLTFSDSKKAEALADSFEVQFQPVDNPGSYWGC